MKHPRVATKCQTRHGRPHQGCAFLAILTVEVRCGRVTSGISTAMGGDKSKDEEVVRMKRENPSAYSKVMWHSRFGTNGSHPPGAWPMSMRFICVAKSLLWLAILTNKIQKHATI